MAARQQAVQKAAILPAVLILSSGERLVMPFFALRMNGDKGKFME